MWNFRDLQVWQEGKEITFYCYAYTKQLPDTERYNLTTQIQRAAISGPANIAEGCSRKTSKDFARFIEIALGSYFELETLLEVSEKLYPRKDNQYDALHNLIQIQEKKLQSLRNSILC